jgi:thioredoxin 1
MSELTINDSNFENDVIEASKSKPVLVDFWASWCPPCRVMAPIIEELAKDYDGKAFVGKYNVEESAGVAEKLGVQSIPAFFIFKDGKIVDQWAGAMDKSVVAQKIENALK